MKFKQILLTCCLLVLYLQSYTQDRSCDVDNIPFKVGETISYNAVYSWGFIWVNAGEAYFSVKDTVYLGKPSIHYKSEGWSLKQYDWFFKVRDRFEAIVNPITLQSKWFERDTREGGFETFNRYVFNDDRNEVEVISKTSKRPFKKEVLTIKPCVFDVLSAIYYCRTLTFEGLKSDETIPLTMAVDNEIFDLYIRYLGREVLKTHDGKKYRTIKFSAKLVEGTIFTGGEDLFVWVTDDLNRVPVLIEAKILVGSVKAVLTKTQNLKYPVSSVLE
jgi:hypothetical protein